MVVYSRLIRADARRLAGGLLLLAALFLFSGCLSGPQRSFSKRDWKPTNQVQRGQASWYGPGYKGKMTASGEKFNPKDLTAAHKYYAFGTVVQVRNLLNNKTVLVEITDRGPFVAGRIIDLAEGAAKELGMTGRGVVPVEVIVMRPR